MLKGDPLGEGSNAGSTNNELWIYIYIYIFKYSTINTIMNHKATNPLSLLLISVFLLMLCINVYTIDTRQQYSAQQLLLLV